MLISFDFCKYAGTDGLRFILEFEAQVDKEV